MKVLFLLLAGTVLLAPPMAMGANKWYDLLQLGRILVSFDSTTVKTGDILALNTKGGETGGGAFSHFSIVKPPTVTFNMDPALPDSRNTTNSPSINVISTLAPTMLSNGLVFSASADQFFCRHLKLPDYMADTGPVTISFFWTESVGESAKFAYWKFQALPIADEATINASPTYLEVAGPTNNTSTTMHRDDIVTTVTALGWTPGALLFTQIGRDGAISGDTATQTSFLHHVSVEVPVTSLRESSNP
jgi:hypothetical protein